ncbi:hypothetical protein JZ751_016821 [Albula glossodonta]|uniref:Uncharacterized protein n=1 Tax=Albula glossodonta TaxID=121402 RepID=A0A8T2NQ04_9TELE|nr:hypothetical protein JZ751_016821 [Albula glossodonta]
MCSWLESSSRPAPAASACPGDLTVTQERQAPASVAHVDLWSVKRWRTVGNRWAPRRMRCSLGVGDTRGTGDSWSLVKQDNLGQKNSTEGDRPQRTLCHSRPFSGVFYHTMAFLCGVSQAFRNDVDEGPYTKHSNPSRPPEGALAIRRQSIPDNTVEN